jgi:hypothetical protein
MLSKIPTSERTDSSELEEAAFLEKIESLRKKYVESEALRGKFTFIAFALAAELQNYMNACRNMSVISFAIPVSDSFKKTSFEAIDALSEELYPTTHVYDKVKLPNVSNWREAVYVWRKGGLSSDVPRPLKRCLPLEWNEDKRVVRRFLKIKVCGLFHPELTVDMMHVLAHRTGS